jgi:hypothetical protein
MNTKLNAIVTAMTATCVILGIGMGDATARGMRGGGGGGGCSRAWWGWWFSARWRRRGWLFPWRSSS